MSLKMEKFRNNFEIEKLQIHLHFYSLIRIFAAYNNK